VIWYRRFFYDYKISSTVDREFSAKLQYETQTELKTLFDYLCKVFQDKIWLPHYKGFTLNKLEGLALAKESGLLTPATIITNNKKDVLRFCKDQNGAIITKAITDDSKSYYIKDDFAYFAFTKLLDEQTICELNDYFFPSLFQQALATEFEIRVFILETEFFATAIINTDSEKNIDRKLSGKSPRTHYVPFNLPDEIKNKMIVFMQKANLNTGSIDLILTKEGFYYFLEINPGGQFLFPSEKCNYYIEKHVAEWLILKDKS
jgi:hypothetical protein